jgi:hypothetical protein
VTVNSAVAAANAGDYVDWVDACQGIAVPVEGKGDRLQLQLQGSIESLYSDILSASMNDWQPQLNIDTVNGGLGLWTSASGGSPLTAAQFNALIGSGDYNGTVWVSTAAIPFLVSGVAIGASNSASGPAGGDFQQVGTVDGLTLDYEAQPLNANVVARPVNFKFGGIGGQIVATIDPRFIATNGTLYTVEEYLPKIGQTVPMFGVDKFMSLDLMNVPNGQVKNFHWVQFFYCEATLQGTLTGQAKRITYNGSSTGNPANPALGIEANPAFPYTSDPKNILWQLDNFGKSVASYDEVGLACKSPIRLDIGDGPQEASADNALTISSDAVTKGQLNTVSSCSITMHFETYLVYQTKPGQTNVVAKIGWESTVTLNVKLYNQLVSQSKKQTREFPSRKLQAEFLAKACGATPPVLQFVTPAGGKSPIVFGQGMNTTQIRLLRNKTLS